MRKIKSNLIYSIVTTMLCGSCFKCDDCVYPNKDSDRLLQGQNKENQGTKKGKQDKKNKEEEKLIREDLGQNKILKKTAEEGDQRILNQVIELSKKTAGEGEKRRKSELKNGQSKDECSICLDELYGKDPPEKVVKGCRANHQFHYMCIMAWMKKDKTCPVCRRDIIIRCEG